MAIHCGSGSRNTFCKEVGDHTKLNYERGLHKSIEKEFKTIQIIAILESQKITIEMNKTQLSFNIQCDLNQIEEKRQYIQCQITF